MDQTCSKITGVIKDSPTAAQACAACKFQRRKCARGCPLAPFFPAHRLNDFQDVHKVFGVKNILKILRNIEYTERSIAAECLIFEANCRVNDPVGGCYKIIATLQREIGSLEAQLQLVLCQIVIRRREREAAMVIKNPTGSLDDAERSIVYGGSTTMDLKNYEDRFRKEWRFNGSGRVLKEENGASLSCTIEQAI